MINMVTNKKINNIVVLSIFLAILFIILWLPVHEEINHYIFKSYGINSTIHFGELYTNDCPYDCSNYYTAIMWTAENSTQFYNLNQTSPVKFSSMINEISLNEKVDNYTLTFGIFIIGLMSIIVLINEYFDGDWKNKK